MSKPYLAIEQQLKVLTYNKGLIISDINTAREVLKDIGYFSLIGGYKRNFINPMTRKYEIPTMKEGEYDLTQPSSQPVTRVQ